MCFREIMDAKVGLIMEQSDNQDVLDLVIKMKEEILRAKRTREVYEILKGELERRVDVEAIIRGYVEYGFQYEQAKESKAGGFVFCDEDCKLALRVGEYQRSGIDCHNMFDVRLLSEFCDQDGISLTVMDGYGQQNSDSFGLRFRYNLSHGYSRVRK